MEGVPRDDHTVLVAAPVVGGVLVAALGLVPVGPGHWLPRVGPHPRRVITEWKMDLYVSLFYQIQN